MMPSSPVFLEYRCTEPSSRNERSSVVTGIDWSDRGRRVEHQNAERSAWCGSGGTRKRTQFLIVELQRRYDVPWKKLRLRGSRARYGREILPRLAPAFQDPRCQADINSSKQTIVSGVSGRARRRDEGLRPDRGGKLDLRRANASR